MISLDPAVKYTTQQSAWSCPLKGRLTDRRIAYYQKRGYYTNGIAVVKRRQLTAKQKIIQTLLGNYV